MSNQKRQTKDYHDREIKFRALAENSAVMIGILRDRKFVYVNPYTEYVLEYSRDELLAMNFRELILPKSQRPLLTKIERQLRCGKRSVYYEVPVIAKSGRTKWLYFSFASYTYQRQPAIIGAAIDITDRKQIEAERNYLIAILAETPDIVTRADTTGKILYFNRAARRLLGIPEKGSLSGWNLNDLYPDWTQKIIQTEGIPAALKNGSWRGEVALLNDQGDAIPVSQIILVHRDEHGDVKYFSTIAHDISEQKERERALKDSWEQYRTLVRTTPDAITMTGLSGVINFASPQTVKLHGYEKHQELIGKNALDLIEPTDHEKALGNMQRTLNNGEIKKVEYTMLRKDGTRLVGELSAALIRDADGAPKAFIATTRDISDRKAAEQERLHLLNQLQAERSKLEKTIEFAPAGIVVCDDQARIILTNAVAEKLCFYPAPVEQNDENHEGLKLCHTDGTPIPPHELPLTRAALDGETVTEFECAIVQADGERIYLLVNTVPIYDSQNNITGAIGMFLDITRRKELQQELIKAYDEMEDKVVERTKELQNVNKALNQQAKERRFYQNKLRALTFQLLHTEERERRRIATGIHDNIVQELVFAKNQLSELLKNGNLENRRNELENLRELLGQAISETRTLTFEISPPVLYELGLVPAIEWYAEEFKSKHGLEISVVDDGTEKPIGEDNRNILFQSVRELFTNVIKHAAAHQVKITIKEEGNKLSIVFEDNGKGFDSSKIFNTMDKFSGFGLFNVRERLDYMGGEFYLESEIGKGTTIILKAPLNV